MRITSGTAKGQVIKMPAGPEIRPTLDMTRKAVFDILGEKVQSARFLDLFAGTGANGIEALSRGASFAVFVDNSRYCIKAITETLVKTAFDKSANVIRSDALTFIERFQKKIKSSDECFDIIFADPPYDTKSLNKGREDPLKHDSMAEITLHKLSSGNILTNNAPLVIIEHSAKTEMPDNEGNLEIWKRRQYGSTKLSIYCMSV